MLNLPIVKEVTDKLRSTMMQVGRLLSVGMWLPVLLTIMLEEVDPWGPGFALVFALIICYFSSWVGVGILIGVFMLSSGGGL